MTPTELFQEARLTEAIAAQRAVVDMRSDDVRERLVLAELLAFGGDRNEVRRQLDYLTSGPPEIQDYLAEWRRLLAADDARHAGIRPGFLVDPPPHILRRLQADELISAGREEEALDVSDDADDLAACVEGYVDGRPFNGWRDADDLLGPVVEAFHGDRYVWIPVEQIRKLRLEEGDELRDTLYRPATVWLTDGQQFEIDLPGLYTGTGVHPEDGIRSGAGVDWIERGGLMRGLGARTYLVWRRRTGTRRLPPGGSPPVEANGPASAGRGS